VTFDCSDAEIMARFWSEVTRGPRTKVEMPGNPFWWVGPDRDAASPHLVLSTCRNPSTAKNRVHLDLQSYDETQAQGVARLQSLGARIVDDRRGLSPGGWVVMADIESNEFCVEGGE